MFLLAYRANYRVRATDFKNFNSRVLDLVMHSHWRFWRIWSSKLSHNVTVSMQNLSGINELKISNGCAAQRRSSDKLLHTQNGRLDIYWQYYSSVCVRTVMCWIRNVWEILSLFEIEQITVIYRKQRITNI